MAPIPATLHHLKRRNRVQPAHNLLLELFGPEEMSKIAELNNLAAPLVS